MKDRVQELAEQSIEAKRLFFSTNAGKVAAAAELLIDSLRGGGKVLIFGNGGSAADAQHIAAELVNRFNRDHPPIPAIALTTDSSVLTSISNDSSFSDVFARQVRALGRAGDAAIAISTSGNSPNVIEAAAAAKEMSIKTIGLTGREGGRLARLVDLALVVECESTQRIQEVHITVGHILCELIEDALYPPNK